MDVKGKTLDALVKLCPPAPAPARLAQRHVVPQPPPRRSAILPRGRLGAVRFRRNRARYLPRAQHAGWRRSRICSIAVPSEQSPFLAPRHLIFVHIIRIVHLWKGRPHGKVAPIGKVVCRLMGMFGPDMLRSGSEWQNAEFPATARGFL